jgi:signal transduction histidine kinase
VSAGSGTDLLPRRRWWQYAGPWPLRPWMVSLTVGAAVFIVNTSTWRESSLQGVGRVVAEDLTSVAAGAFAVGTAVDIARRALGRPSPSHLVPYLCVLAIAAGVAALVLGAVETAFGSGTALEPQDLLLRAMRIWIMTVVASAIAGVTEERLSRQTRIAQQSFAELREQQSLMLIHEERSRRQFAMLLHDRVQAGLMTACLELKAASRGPAVDRQRFDDAIARIDDLRGLDVHQTARALSPDLANIGLKGALQELLRTYGPGLASTVTITPEISMGQVSIPSNTLLACYRIVEQGVLNSVVHGHATECQITVAVGPRNTVDIEVIDNGTGGTKATGISGFGSAVLDSWCRALNGSWDLQFPEAGGAHLIAMLSLEFGAELDLRDEGMSLQ